VSALACDGDGEAGTSSGSSGGGGGAGGGSSAELTAACQARCQSMIDRGCSADSLEVCVQQCEAGNMAPECTAQYIAVLECQAAEQMVCNEVPAACQDEVQAWGGCMNGGCVPSGCSGGTSDCSCDADCGGTAVTVECAQGSGAEITCTCIADGATLGTCQNQGSLPECSPPESCCASLFGL
jgi:hypothetical protein